MNNVWKNVRKNVLDNVCDNMWGKVLDAWRAKCCGHVGEKVGVVILTTMRYDLWGYLSEIVWDEFEEK